MSSNSLGLCWYRHSGQEEINKIPYIPGSNLKKIGDYKDITDDVGYDYITHMHIELGDEMPPLHLICPHVIHLKIVGIQNSHSWECLKSLRQLQVLSIWNNNFYRGLPDVISELRKLRKLDLWECDLVDLPLSLTNLEELEELHLSNNDFAQGVPDVILNLKKLKVLNLEGCSLTDLPQSLHLLSNLTELDISRNMFAKLPPVIYQLSNLQKLDARYNQQLHTIDIDILELTKLEHIECMGSESLKSPPNAVCQRGLSAIKKYFEDYSYEPGTEVVVAPVAVVGNLMAGKTSLIRSLKWGKRKLTERQDSSSLDETTQVFKMETLQLTNSLVKLIDFGGHDIYHMAYQLTLKEQCIPFIVINLEEYGNLLSTRGPREATSRLCFDWMSHLYLACPRLGAPILILTHKDKLSDENIKPILHIIRSSAEIIRRELLEEEKSLGKGGELHRILHLSDTEKPLFLPDEIFLFGEDETNIESLKECLEKRCKNFKMAIPRLWERLSSYIENITSKPFVLFSDIQNEFPDEKQLEVILGYLHDTGRVLWFENKESLKKYIFHQVPEITQLIALLFHHTQSQKWEERIATYTVFTHNGQTIEKLMFEQLVSEFQASGVLNEALLMYLLKSKPSFPQEIAVGLLRSFYIIHGPIKQEFGDGYIIPYFSSIYMDKKWLSNGDVRLRLDVLFNGLPIPKYVYQLMTVAALNFRSDLTHTVKVACNGVSIFHGEYSSHLMHDHNNRKVTLQVCTPVGLIGSSWQHLLELSQCIIDETMRVWKAARPVFVFYCAHCLFRSVDNPSTKINPDWFRCIHNHVTGDSSFPSATTFTGIEPVDCAHGESKGKRTVPKPFRFPCYELNPEEILKLEKYLITLGEDSPSTAGPQTTQTSTSSPAICERAEGQLSRHEVQTTEDDNDSDVSDIEEEGYVDIDERRTDNVIINLELKPCTKESVTRLYFNRDKVYPMEDRVRGRVLIFNNIVFRNRPEWTRHGSNIDVANIKRLFEKMNFEMGKADEDLTDLTAEELLEVIKVETQLDVHYRYSMFVLFLLSHGDKNDKILCSDNEYVELNTIKDLLSASKFPAMKGKPKLIIVQACSGDNKDFGDHGPSSNNLDAVASTPFDLESVPPGVRATQTENSLTSTNAATENNMMSTSTANENTATSTANENTATSTASENSAAFTATENNISSTRSAVAIPASTNIENAMTTATTNDDVATVSATTESVITATTTTVRSFGYISFASTPTANHSPTSPTSPTSDVMTASSTSNDSLAVCVQSSDATPSIPVADGVVTLDGDDFCTLKASTDSYVSLRSCSHGSLFIRLLVATFYKHSCHRDVESMFKIIQQRVRKSSIDRRKLDKEWLGGVIPDSRCTFTNYRKLYFFPNYPPADRQTDSSS